MDGQVKKHIKTYYGLIELLEIELLLERISELLDVLKLLIEVLVELELTELTELVELLELLHGRYWSVKGYESRAISGIVSNPCLIITPTFVPTIKSLSVSTSKLVT